MIATIYAALVYALFLATFATMIGFVEGVLPWKTIDSGAPGSTLAALLVDGAWFVVFALQHSLMARAPFKRRLARVIPPHAERATFVLASTLMCIALLVVWRPLPTIVWQARGVARVALYVISFAGWAIVLVSSCLIDHFELFGLRQALWHQRGVAPLMRPLVTPGFYRWVRHPLYVGFLIGFWVAPTMTVGHALCAAGMTLYILLGIHFEERDLVRTFGADYQRYQREVGMLIPRRHARE